MILVQTALQWCLLYYYHLLNFYCCAANEPSEWLRSCCVVNFIYFQWCILYVNKIDIITCFFLNLICHTSWLDIQFIYLKFQTNPTSFVIELQLFVLGVTFYCDTVYILALMDMMCRHLCNSSGMSWYCKQQWERLYPHVHLPRPAEWLPCCRFESPRGTCWRHFDISAHLHLW